jgi:hypothetical protein
MFKGSYRLICVALLALFSFGNQAFSEGKHLKIAMLQWRGETEGCVGFQDGLRELGYTVDYTVLNAGRDKKELGRLLGTHPLPL